MAGDTNLHHYQWSTETGREHQLANHLLEVTEEQGLTLLNTPGEVTRRRQRINRLKESIIDLTFALADLAEQLISCKVRTDLGFELDYLALKIVLGLDDYL